MTTFFDFRTEQVQLYSDEERLLAVAGYTHKVVDWFAGLIQPAPSQIIAGQTVPGRFCNQIRLLAPVRDFLAEAATLRLGKKNGTVQRLEKVLAVHAEVVAAYNLCTSSALRKFTHSAIQMLPMVQKRGACFERLERALNVATQTGLFLRRYRNDDASLEDHSESSDASPGVTINFNNADQRVDYLNTEVSVFVEPELQSAEMYFHTMLTQQGLQTRMQRERGVMQNPMEGGPAPSQRRLLHTGAKTVANSVKTAYNRFQTFRGQNFGKMLPAPRSQSEYSSSDSDSSPTMAISRYPHYSPAASAESAASAVSPLAAMSRHSSSSSAASVASARSGPARASSSSTGKKTKTRPRARSQEARKVSPTLKIRRKTH